MPGRILRAFCPCKCGDSLGATAESCETAAGLQLSNCPPRTVRADNTFSFKSVRFEAPRHLPQRTIQIRFERKRPTQRVIVYYKAERMGEARPLDPVANDRNPSPQ